MTPRRIAVELAQEIVQLHVNDDCLLGGSFRTPILSKVYVNDLNVKSETNICRLLDACVYSGTFASFVNGRRPPLGVNFPTIIIGKNLLLLLLSEFKINK